MTHVLTDRCVIAITDILLLWCKAVVGEEDFLSELCVDSALRDY